MGRIEAGAFAVMWFCIFCAHAFAQLAPDEGKALILLDGPINWAGTTEFANPVFNTPTEVPLTHR